LAREKLGEESARIFEAQLLMLRDEALYEAVIERIRLERSNADYSVMAVMMEHRQRMEASDNEYLRERANDLQDVQDRLITHLRRGKHLSAIIPETIVIAENLTAADIVLFSRRGILGYALDHGGTTSHVSIMARALGVPAVSSVQGLTSKVQHGDIFILDGMDGRIIVNPDEETLAHYRVRQERYARLVEEHRQLAHLPAETIDKHHVRLMANVEFDQEVSVLEEYGAEGIGLVRTEMLLLMQGHTKVSEEAQFKAYRKLLEATAPHPTTIRILDLGGDKMLPVAHREHNPFLGWRGIRVLLDKPELLVPQLRALLRASIYGPLRMLIPMVTEITELHRFKEMLGQVQKDLDREGLAYDDVQIGIMVEVPAVALLAERFATEVDFFSLGTNDLTQYTLAVDRGNDLVSGLFHELHPAVLLLIKTTIDAGKKHGIPVSLCGEMGGDPKAIPILVGLGLEELSVSPSYLPEIKRVIRSMNCKEAKDLAVQALTARNVLEVEAMLNEWLEEHHCGLRHLLKDPRNGEENL
jgi:phosphotransferase system enzyme I (PtsI)